MTEYTRPATWEDVKALARYLEESGAEYALVGAYAIAAHGFSRFSKPHVVTMLIDDVPIRVLDLPGLLKTKQGVRPKDQMDAAVIAEALRRLDEGK